MVTEQFKLNRVFLGNCFEFASNHFGIYFISCARSQDFFIECCGQLSFSLVVYSFFLFSVMR